MKILPVNKGLVTFDIKWRATTAGPSPDNNQRVELFLLGCKKAKKGNPCKGCFNSITWDIEKAEFSRDPIEVADFIAENAPNKYITIGGGEPTDQIDALIPLTKKLKEHGFHIMMYTWRDYEYETNLFHHLGEIPYPYRIPIEKWVSLGKYIDVLIDGEYIQEERMYVDNINHGLLSAVGSGNQKIWDIKKMRDTKATISYPMRELSDIILDENNNLVYIKKEGI